MKPSYKLKEPFSKGTTLIYLKVYFGGKRFVYSTGFNVEPANWLPDKQRCKEIRDFREGRFINNELDRISKLFMEAYYESDKTIEHVRVLLEAKINRVNKPKELSFIKYFEIHKDWFINKYGKESGKKFGTILNYLKKFFKSKGREYNWNDINLTFAEEFEEFLYKQKGVKSPNHVATMFVKIKTVMKAAFDKDLHTNTKFSQIKYREVDVHKIFLTENDLNKMWDAKELTKPEIDVRDTFLFECYTGLRYSDIKRLNNAHFKDDTIQIVTEKTGVMVVIPIHPRIREILENRYYKIPRVYANQKMNEHLKKIGEKAELNEKIIVSKIENRRNVDEIKFKYDLITTHTARRSFITNLLLNGASTLSIMKMTGHTTDKSFLKYVKMSSEQNANIMKGNPFFKQK